MITDAAGNGYVAGDFDGTLTLGSGLSRVTLNGGGGFVAKYSASGLLLWARGITDPNFEVVKGLAIAVDGAGNAFVTGHFAGVANFGPSIQLTGPDPKSSTFDDFVTRLDSSGHFIWADGLAVGTTDEFTGQTIAVDSQDDVFVTGSYSTNATLGSIQLPLTGFANAFVTELNSAGHVVWAQSIGVDPQVGKFAGEAKAEAFAVATDDQGGVYVTGYFQSLTDFGPTIQQTASTQDAFVCKLDDLGTFQWVDDIVGSNNDFGDDGGTGLTADSSGNVYLTGVYSGFAEFGPIFLNAGKGIFDGFVCKLDSSGNFHWASDIGSSGGTNPYVDPAGIAVDARDNVYLTGSYYGTARFGTTTIQTTASADQDGFVSKLDGGGNFLWASDVGGADSVNAFGSSIAADASANLYFTGGFNGTADFDLAPAWTTHHLSLFLGRRQ